MKAVILAGGLGARLKPFTQVIPKPLLPIGESSVLEIQILSLEKFGVKDVFIATNYKSKYVEAFLGAGEKYGVKLHISKEKEPLGTCGPVLLMKDKLTSPFFLINGDILTMLDFKKAYKFALASEADLTVVTKKITTPFNFGKVTAKDNYLIDIEEKPDFKLDILAGIYILKPAVLNLIPKNTYYGIDTLIKDMLARKMKVACYPMSEYWLDIGHMEDYSVAQTAYKKHFNKLKKNHED
jgi:NDP-sugar pyrophosphorylase family protein